MYDDIVYTYNDIRLLHPSLSVCNAQNNIRLSVAFAPGPVSPQTEDSTLYNRLIHSF